MQRFAGSKSSKFEWLFCVLAYAGMMGLGFFGLYDADRHSPHPGYFGVCLASIGLFGVIGAGAIAYFLIVHTVYEADDAELIQRGAFGRIRRMRWRDIAQMNERSGIHDSSITLTDNGGEKMRIQLSLLEESGAGLRALIIDRLQALRDRQADDFAAQERTLGVAPRGSTLLLATIGFLLLIIAAGIHHFAYEPTVIPICIMLAVLGLAFLLLTGLIATKSVTFSRQEVRERWLWSEKRLRLHDVESIFVHMPVSDTGSYETITLCGSGRRLQFGSTMPDYPLLRDSLLRSVPSEAIRSGERNRIGFDAKQNRIMLTILSVCCVYLVGAGIWFLCGAITKFNRIDRLAKQGVFTTARVTGDDCGCSDGYLKEVKYAFTVNGKPYTGDNTLSFSGARIRMGDRVEVCYLPANPAENRLRVLLDWRYMLLPLIAMVAACFASPLIIPAYFRTKKRMDRQKARAASGVAE